MRVQKCDHCGKTADRPDPRGWWKVTQTTLTPTAQDICSTYCLEQFVQLERMAEREIWLRQELEKELLEQASV